MKRVHFIAIGGSAMHNLALALLSNGYRVSGSDDEIYEPSLSRLKEAGICPESFGWHPEKISTDIDIVVLGMHARKDNPELLKAMDLGIKIMSYPEFLYHQSVDKKRIVIAGSHGKTTTTSMIIHVLTQMQIPCDYMVGAQLEGFDRMVKLSNAPLIVLEGDEYLSSPIDSSSKFSHYHPHISVITGIDWDHINVFPTQQSYIDRFGEFIEEQSSGKVFYCQNDKVLTNLIETSTSSSKKYGYPQLQIDEYKNVIFEGNTYDFKLIGKHNLENAHAALMVCQELGVEPKDFFNSLSSFKGAAKRMQPIFENDTTKGFIDFAHAPSKVMATTQAVKDWFPQDSLLALFELHTFSSLNKDFLPQYKHTLNTADKAVIFYDNHTLTMKSMPPLDKEFVINCFDHKDLVVFDDRAKFHQYLDKLNHVGILLMMSSGNFGKYDLNKLNRW